jgi:alpha-L-fucosidase
MATFFRNGDPGCGADNWNADPPASSPSSFAPTNLNCSQWADSMQDLGVTEAVLTAKHGCGFYLWPTTVTLPGGRPYGYSVNSSLNVLRLFTDAMNDRGIGHGFYYSLTNNFFLNEFGFAVHDPSTLIPNQENVTQSQWEAIAIASLTELWTGERHQLS